jgi:histidine triad (HIT) family protein
MSIYGTYDPDNIFARVIRGELPCHKVYENEDVLAFLDLFPQSRGHTLVIPKKEQARNLLELDDAAIGPLFRAVKTVMKAVIAEVEPDGVQVHQFNGGEGSQSVFHIHVHIVPRWPGQPLGMHGQTRGDDAQLAALAARLRARLAGEAHGRPL